MGYRPGGCSFAMSPNQCQLGHFHRDPQEVRQHTGVLLQYVVFSWAIQLDYLQVTDFSASKCWLEHLARHLDFGDADQDPYSDQKTNQGQGYPHSYLWRGSPLLPCSVRLRTLQNTSHPADIFIASFDCTLSDSTPNQKIHFTMEHPLIYGRWLKSTLPLSAPQFQVRS
jgi:hypothetical protein